MDPKIFEAHGGNTQPYPTTLPDDRPKVSILAPWRSPELFCELFASIDWSVSNELILMVPKGGEVKLPSYPHPKVQFIELHDNYDLRQIVNELYNKKIITASWFYFSTGKIPLGLWTMLRGVQKPLRMAPQLGKEYLWSAAEPFLAGVELMPEAKPLLKQLRTTIQPLTIHTNGTFTELCGLATKYCTDKTVYNLFTHKHPYTPIYSMFLGALRTVGRPLIIGEIGVLNGASIRMWNDYFVEAEIHAFDIDPKALKSVEQIPNVKTHILDGDNALQINKTFIGLPQFDLLLEDASHCLGHQVTCLRECMKYVAVGGFLIIEDIFRAIPLARFQEAIDAVTDSGLNVEAFMITPEDLLRSSPNWENDRILIVRRLA